MSWCFKVKKERGKDEKALIRNGGMLLEKLIALNNGRSNPIRCFSIKELNDATNNYDQDQVISNDEHYTMYKGFLQDRPVIVKKYKGESFLENSINDIVFSSQMSVHNNVLKLLGCCLESNTPILVLEYAKREILKYYVYRHYRTEFKPLTWKNRLKIAVDVANVIAYLHTAFRKPIVHRDLRISNIMLEEENMAKVNDFSFSMSIPEGETHIIDTVKGTLGYMAPEYYSSGGTFNEKIDVYSFGALLLVLLTGRKAHERVPIPCPSSTTDEYYYGLVDYVKKNVEKEKVDEILDPIIVEEELSRPRLKAFALLALQCTSICAEDRPEITDVGKQLGQMYRSLISDYS
ncbi:non-functional pseudokinase ZED1-like [Euphorbia lathyris]|uniref:non-functional pseudokinase ZED1-like n=1 Tax=Euphorbia lathyris TaxID=212925 RepID=UPI0033133CB1